MRNKSSDKGRFRLIYICYASVLAVAVIACLIYVNAMLRKYESSQPERRVEEQIELLRSAAASGDLSSAMGTDDLSADEVSALSDAIKSGSLTYKLTKNSDGGEELVYTILSGDSRLADVTLHGKVGKTKLLLFTITDWSVSSVDAAAHEYDLILPATLTVRVGDSAVSGEPVGDKLKYSVRAPIGKDVIITDAVGNTFVYDGETKLSLTEYIINIPSNYTVGSDHGTAPQSLAALTPIDDYKYVAEYTKMPENATYTLNLIGEDPKFVIRDNLGGNVEYTLDGHTVTVTGQAALDKIPEDVYSAETALEHARTWSLFMTADLGGAKHGFDQVAEFLMEDSYLEEVAYKWATGVDITFTSGHTLDYPPFTGESVSNYIKYTDECFSCDIKLSKVMHLNSGDNVTDTMNSRFFYIQKDGEWYVCDIQEIIG